jgi:glycosyltransferase involved in cell wall biosynthesis
MYLKRFLLLADHFVSPSRFLAERYVAWGIDPRRLSVIENGMPEHGLPPAQPPLREDGEEVVIGFFGQISRLKGIDVLIDAGGAAGEGGGRGHPHRHPRRLFRPAPRLPRAVRGAAGEAARQCPPLRPLREPPRPPADAGVDAVIVPSIWWENSPLVIQEALLNRRPVITSDIGGMAEKVRDGLDGFHFQAGSAFALASLLRGLAAARNGCARCSDARHPARVQDTAAATLKLYRRLRAARPAERPPAQEIAA